MGVKIPSLPVASALDGSEILEIVQGAASKKTTIQDIAGLTTLDKALAAGSTLTEDRTVDLSSNAFSIQENGLPLLNIDPAGGITQLWSRNATGGGNNAYVNPTTSDTESAFTIGADFNGGAKSAAIEGISDVTTATLNFIADTNTFNGDAILAGFAGGGTTGASIDDTGKLIRTP